MFLSKLFHNPYKLPKSHQEEAREYYNKLAKQYARGNVYLRMGKSVSESRAKELKEKALKIDFSKYAK